MSSRVPWQIFCATLVFLPLTPWMSLLEVNANHHAATSTEAIEIPPFNSFAPTISEEERHALILKLQNAITEEAQRYEYEKSSLPLDLVREFSPRRIFSLLAEGFKTGTRHHVGELQLQGEEYVGVDQLPEFIKTQEFRDQITLQHSDQPSSFDPLLQTIQQLNAGLTPQQKLHFLAFKRTSRSVDLIPGSDSSDRGMIYVPAAYLMKYRPSGYGPPHSRDSKDLKFPELFIQYTIRQWPLNPDLPPDAARFSEQLSIVGVVKGGGVKSLKPEPNAVYFRDYTFALKKNRQGDSCLNCHIQGPLSIWSTPDQILAHLPDTSAENALATLNQRILSAAGEAPGAPPPLVYLGIMAKTETAISAQTIQTGCGKLLSSPIPPERVQAIQKAMECRTCHDEKRHLPPVSFDGKWNSKPFTMIEGHILSGKMPPNNQLSQEERKVLAACIQLEAQTRVIQPFIHDAPSLVRENLH